MTDKTGGSAFPRNILDHSHGIESHVDAGMTLRDYFAAKAMQALITGHAPSTSRTNPLYSEWAYQIADEMIKAREVV